MTITSVNIQDGTFTERRCRHRIKKRYTISIAAILIIIIIFVIYMLTKSVPKEEITVDFRNQTPPNPEYPLPPSPSVMRSYRQAAVSSDAEICSAIGKDILENNGSAVDAAIAAMFCNGLVTMQSMGLGGGFLMTIYSKEEGQVHTLNAREVAPLKATEDMFNNQSQKSKVGPLAIGVPGELKGYRVAHQYYGKLPWASLVEPTINLCKLGFNISRHQSNALKYKLDNIRNESVLAKLFIDNNGDLKPVGEKVIHTQYCKTLELIAKNGDDLYNGSLADILVKDIEEMGGIITKEDLQKYKVKWERPVQINLKDYKLYSIQSPGGGNLLAFILNILQGYEFKKEELIGAENAIRTYHRIIEAFKFAFAKRSLLGDPSFVEINGLLANLTDNNIAEEIRKMILDNTTFTDPIHYEAEGIQKDDHGTAHISVLAPNGDAVSVTSTINLYFGAGVVSKNTGIILNSGMDDFSSNGFENFFQLPFSEANKIEPGKRPLSSMSPAIVLDKDNNVKLVIGAAGGTKIPTSVALVIMKCLWFNQTLKEAIDAPRLHHQVFPMEVNYDFGVPESIVAGLEKLGHKTTRSTGTGSVINAIFRDNGTVFANADYRKWGDVAGF